MNKKVLLPVFIVVVAVLLGVIVRLERDVTAQTLENVSDRLSLALRAQLEKRKVDALRYALVMSQNAALVEALDNDDEDKGYRILSELMESIQQHTNVKIRTQIITDDYTIFARSWDNSFAGMPIDEYRPDLHYFQENKKPRSAIEVGRRLGIKATVPVYSEHKLIGFVEVLQFFESTTDFFRSMGIDLYILLHERFYSIAILMQDNPFTGEYIVANRHYNAAHLPLLKSLDYKRLAQERILAADNKYVVYEPMQNGSGETIGAFVFLIAQSEIENFTGKEDEIAFLINFSHNDLYDIIKKESFGESFFQSNYDKDLIYLKDVVADEDRELFMEEAYERLSEYSKEELIGLLLGHNASRRIRGEIR